MPRASTRKRAAPEPDPVADLAAQNAVLQERFDTLKSLYEKNLEQSRATDQRLDRIEAALAGRGEVPAAKPVAAAAESVTEGEMRRLREQNEALLKSLAASNEAAEQARVAARQAEEKLAAAQPAGQTELDEAAAAEALFNAKEKAVAPAKLEEMINIVIKTLEGDNKVHIMARKSTKVSTIAGAVWARFAIDPNGARLMFDCQRLDMSDTLESVGMENGDEIEVWREQAGC